MYLFEITKEQPKFARFEIESLLQITLDEMFEGLFLSCEDNLNLELFSRLAYTRKVFKILDIQDKLEDFSFNKLIKESYKLDFNNFDGLDMPSSKVYDYVYHQLKNPLVEINSPKHIYTIYFMNKKFYLAEQIYLNQDKTSERRAHLRVYNHPTSLHPKQAKAMINCVVQKSFLDPFCGTGGILIEGSLMGLDVYGSDIAQKMIEYSKKNLLQLNLEAKLEVKNAIFLDKMVEAIVTDLPFGKNSLISDDSEILVMKFLRSAEKVTNKLCIGYLSTLNLNNLVEKTNWKIKKTFNIYVHNTMTRSISVLSLI